MEAAEKTQLATGEGLHDAECDCAAAGREAREAKGCFFGVQMGVLETGFAPEVQHFGRCLEQPDRGIPQML